MSTPQSIINICSGVLLTNDYIHTIWFANQSDQLNYFAGKVVKTFSAYTYLRKSWNIKVEATMEQARTWTYLYFNNNGKTYYYFINNIEYVNENTVELFIEMDVLQTYLNEYTLHPCFVEREHASSDNVGAHLIDEGLELGEIIVNHSANVDMGELCVLVMTSFDPIATSEGEIVPPSTREYDGVYSGLCIHAITMDRLNALSTRLSQYDSWGISDGVVSMWMYPKDLIKLKDGHTFESTDTLFKPVAGTKTVDHDITTSPTVAGYTPLNNKLFCYPYSFIYVSNNAGGSCIYQHERFDTITERVRVTGALTPEGGVKLYPLAYKGIALNYEEGIMGASYPTCAWNQDVYKLWLAQNQNQQKLSLGMGALSVVGGIAGLIASPFTGGASALGGVGGIVGGASAIAGVLAGRGDKEVQPPQSKGSYSASVNIKAEHQTFTIQNKSVSLESARTLDDYFSLYGYKTQRVKVPNRHVRENWTYTKTIGCHVSGNICTDDLNKIQSIYDNGITFWSDGDNIGNYLSLQPFGYVMYNPCL